MSRSEIHRQIPAAESSGLVRSSGVSSPNDSKNRHSLLPINSNSRLYPAKSSGNTGPQTKTATKTTTGKTVNQRPELSPNSRNGDVKETKLNQSTTATTTATATTTTTATTTAMATSQGSGKGHGCSQETNVQSLNIQNGNDGSLRHRKKNDGQLSFVDSKIYDAVAQSLSGLSISGNSVERSWTKGRRRTGNEGGGGDEDDDPTSDISTPTSGYATDRSTDHFRHEAKADGRTTTVVRSFETTPAYDDDEGLGAEEHPYFARLAAEAEQPTPIISRSGSFRGVKNRVRAGIASLLDKSDGKKSVNYSLSEKGKVVFYTTSVTVVRETSDRCYKVKRILQTQMVEFDERDVFMSKACHQELAERLHPDAELPQVFVDGHHLGGPEEIERLNENGTLRKIFSNFPKVQQTSCCRNCGGFRFVPCTSCRGSKKSKRNCFTDEFCALRCTKCDDNGLVKCNACNSNAADCEPRREA